MADMSGTTVIVTGAGSGIGAATARRFGRDGANVVLAGRRADRLEEVAGSIEGGRALACPTDVSDQGAVERLVEAAVARFGGVDVLVNNAGTAKFGGFLDASLDDYRRTMTTNVDGAVYAIRAAMPHLTKTKGNIVNVSSVSGTGGDAGLAFYNASKGALSNLTRALALEFGPRGVRVNAVNPSFTRTEMTSGIADNPQIVQKFLDRIPLGRPGEAEDVADVIAFLASDDARFVTGVNLAVDGGVSASNGQPRMF